MIYASSKKCITWNAEMYIIPLCPVLEFRNKLEIRTLDKKSETWNQFLSLLSRNCITSVKILNPLASVSLPVKWNTTT